MDNRTAWFLALALSFGGFTLSLIRPGISGLATMLAGGVWLLIIATYRAPAARHVTTLTLLSVGAATIIVSLVLRITDTLVPVQVSLAMAGIGVQVIVASLRLPKDALERSKVRFLAPTIGHGLSLGGAIAIALGPSPIPPAPLLTAMVGYTLLFVDVIWMRRQAEWRTHRGQSWEAFFLLLLSTTLILATTIALVGRNALSSIAIETFLEALLQFTVLIGLAVLADPPGMPHWLTLRPGGLMEFWIDSLSFLVIIESIILLLYIGAPQVIWPLFFLLTAYLVLEVTFEYVAAGHGILHHRRLRREPPPILHGPLPPITVVVACKHESNALFKSLPLNLARLPSVRFLVLYAAPDVATLRLMSHIKGRHGDRVRMIPSPGLSKASDLSQAWRLVSTPYGLILDADETMSNRSLRILMAHMEANPRVGIVQARKVPRDPESDALSSFIAVERRFSTLLDHPYYAERFDASHFAGSAALVRTETPETVGGWHPKSLTEDIEFTIRLYRSGKWDLDYVPDATAEETSPHDFASFIRQRGRWARGWSEVVGLHLVRILLESQRIGRRRSFGLMRQLMTAVNAPVTVFLPLLGILWVIQGAQGLPLWATIGLAVYILPARLFSYVVAWALDRKRPEKHRAWQVVKTAFWGYAWIPMAWLLQLHAIYLIVSGAPRKWLRTRDNMPPR